MPWASLTTKPKTSTRPADRQHVDKSCRFVRACMRACARVLVRGCVCACACACALVGKDSKAQEDLLHGLGQLSHAKDIHVACLHGWLDAGGRADMNSAGEIERVCSCSAACTVGRVYRSSLGDAFHRS